MFQFLKRQNYSANFPVNPAHQSPSYPSRIAYRPDIDGLRALAVLAVVAYHYGPSKVPGGFIGVDVFFVISGYLISSILFQDIVRGHFSVARFYQRRIRRIFPALILALLTCIVVGWFMLFLGEYEQMGKHVLASAGFVQNFVLWSEAGYFDTEAISKPMLHLWSLAVEEQFYIVWPLFLWLISGRGWSAARWIGSVMLVSFIWGVYVVTQDYDVAAFYSPLTRAWELSAGAMLAIWHRQSHTWLAQYPGVQSWLGLILILTGFVLIRPENMFPGFWALLPVLGTALLINAGPRVWVNRVILSNRAAVWIGLISYPLYLWHWLPLSFGTLAFGPQESWGDNRTDSRAIQVGLIVISFVFAWLTYRLVEQPLRYRWPAKQAAFGLLATMFVLGGTGLAIFLTNGVPQRTFAQSRIDTYIESIKYSSLVGECHDLLQLDQKGANWYCILGSKGASRTIVVYGDSHALTLIPALEQYGQAHRTKIIYASNSGCLPLLGVRRTDQPAHEVASCRALNRRISKLARKQNVEAVALIGHWSFYAGVTTYAKEDVKLAIGDRHNQSQEGSAAAFEYGLHQTFDFYQQLNIPVLILEDNPQQLERGLPISLLRFGTPTDDSINATAVSRAEHDRVQALANRLIAEASRTVTNAHVLSIDDALCDAERCPWVRDGRFLYCDDDHLSITGAMAVYPVLAQGLSRILE